MKTYVVDLSAKGVEQIEEIFDKLERLVDDENLYTYIGNKCYDALNEISAKKLSTVNTGEDIEASVYLKAHVMEISDGTIYLYNNSVIDTSEKNISSEKRLNYPLQLSLAKIVEYGIGYTGSINSNSEADNWEYDVNKHGVQGWTYMDNNGVFHWTNGFAGRYIFLELKHYIEKNVAKWIAEYIEKKL